MDDDDLAFDEELAELGRKVERARAERAALEALLWEGLVGTVHATLEHDADIWVAHELGLIRYDLGYIGADAATIGRLRGELVLWHDVRDVEVSFDIEMVGGTPLVVWSILVQYPRLATKGPSPAIRDFAVLLARLASPTRSSLT
jgi:hypothetical protein